MRAVRLLRGDPSSEIAPLSPGAWTLPPADLLIALVGPRRDGRARFDPSTGLRAQRGLRSFHKTQDRLRSGQARLPQVLGKAASDTVCSEPSDFLPTDAAISIQVDDPIQAVRRWCADSCQ